MAALTSAQVAKGLSQVARTNDGTGWALSKLDVSNLDINSLGAQLDNFSHLRYLNASGNSLEDASALDKTPNLLALNLSDNGLSSLPEVTLEHLQVARLSGNKLENPGFPTGTPSLLSLDASSNALNSLEGGL